LDRREWRGLEAELGICARAVGDLGALTVGRSRRWIGGAAASSDWVGEMEKGLEAELGSWARAVGDLGALTMGRSQRWRGGVAASSDWVGEMEKGPGGQAGKPGGLGHESALVIPY